MQRMILLPLLVLLAGCGAGEAPRGSLPAGQDRPLLLLVTPGSVVDVDAVAHVSVSRAAASTVSRRQVARISVRSSSERAAIWGVAR